MHTGRGAPWCTVQSGARRPGCTLVQVHKRPDAPRCTVQYGARQLGCTKVQVHSYPDEPSHGARCSSAPVVTRGATRLGPKPSPRATHAAQRMTTHTLTGPSRPRLALLRRRDHGVLGWRPLRFTTRPSSRPPTRRSHGRGTGVLAPRRLASPQSLSCAIQHVYSLVPQRRRRLLFLSILTGIGTM